MRVADQSGERPWNLSIDSAALMLVSPLIQLREQRQRKHLKSRRGICRCCQSSGGGGGSSLARPLETLEFKDSALGRAIVIHSMTGAMTIDGGGGSSKKRCAEAGNCGQTQACVGDCMHANSTRKRISGSVISIRYFHKMYPGFLLLIKSACVVPHSLTHRIQLQQRRYQFPAASCSDAQ